VTAQVPLSIRALRARSVRVPLARPLVTGGGTVEAAPLVLVDLEAEGGVTGSSYVFCYTPLALGPVTQLVRGLEEALRGEALAPFDIERKLQGMFRLLGPQGLAGIAMAAIDMACWDALARSLGLPLARLLGGAPRPIPAYNSCGLGLTGAAKAATETRELLEPGYRAVKVRLGYPELETDLAVVRAVREAAGPDVLLMADYNQCLDVPEAIRRNRALDHEGLYWIEESTRADDYEGYAAIAAAAETPVQLGENWWGVHDMAKSVARGASDFVMPDASKIGGVTGWLRAAALAASRGLPMSCHLYPEISVHLLTVTPTCHWLEYVDWARPLLQSPLDVVDGFATAPDRPGIGLEWDESAIQENQENQ
jgi:mandelate racemase